MVDTRFLPVEGDQALAERLFRELRADSDDGVGVTRATYGPGETRAIARIEATARTLGLTTARDAAANLSVSLPGADPTLPVVATGSHLDSVPQGGNFDGAAGVIAGLLALAAVARRPRPPRRGLQLWVLRGEESAWFGRCYLGSSALLGAFDPDWLDARHRDDGRALRDWMREAGADPDLVVAGAAGVAPGAVAAFLELHIEQGPVMVHRGWPVALVTGIRGNIRYPRIDAVGEAAHSGAVPRWLRRDAVMAFAELMVRLDGHWRALLEQGEDLVLTSGIVGTDPAEHAMSRVPGRIAFSLEMRSQSEATLDGFDEVVREECRRLEAERRVAFHFPPSVRSAAARMDEGVLARIAEVARCAGLSPERIASGAGHDAAIFANAGVPSAMIFVRNDRGSHNPHEAMDMADFMVGARLLAGAMLDLADAAS